MSGGAAFACKMQATRASEQYKPLHIAAVRLQRFKNTLFISTASKNFKNTVNSPCNIVFEETSKNIKRTFV